MWFVLLHLVVFGFSASRRADWMMPAVPAMAVLAACRWCCHWRAPWHVAGDLCVRLLPRGVERSPLWQGLGRPLEFFRPSSQEAHLESTGAGLGDRKRPQSFDGPAGAFWGGSPRANLQKTVRAWLDGSVAPGEGFWIVAGDRRAFGTQPAQIPASGMDSWDQLDGPVDWRFSVEDGELNTCGQGALRLGWARRRQ